MMLIQSKKIQDKFGGLKISDKIHYQIHYPFIACLLWFFLTDMSGFRIRLRTLPIAKYLDQTFFSTMIF